MLVLKEGILSMRALLFVYLWWQLWLIQYQYGGPVTAMLVLNQSKLSPDIDEQWELYCTYLWWQLWLIQYQYGGLSDCHVSLKEGILKWELYCSSISGDNFDWLTWQSLPDLNIGTESIKVVTRDRRTIDSLISISLLSEGITWAVIVRLSLVTTLIDSVPIWRSSDCHVSLKEGILKWELYCIVYLWWQLWLIQYQYGGLVTAMLVWKKG